jgi:rhombotail lipoprotein
VRAAQQKGFELAMADMTVNLDKELAVFKERIRTDGSVRVTRAAGSDAGGGGVSSAAFLALLAGLSMFSSRQRRR